jgi:hypothetical protein
VPVSDKMLFATDLMGIGVKVDKRLPSWQGLQLHRGDIHFNLELFELPFKLYNGLLSAIWPGASDGLS